MSYQASSTSMYFSPSTTSPALPNLEQVLNVAENKYASLLQEDKWSGVTLKVNETGFNSTCLSVNNDQNKLTFKYKCFNCGGTDHKLENCPKTIDKECIKKNRTQFWKQKREKGNNSPTPSSSRSPPTTGKWVPPSKKEKNQQNIDGTA